MLVFMIRITLKRNLGDKMLGINILFYLMVVSMLLVFTTPVAEGTILLFLCLARSPLCPFRTTTAPP
ncbi:hypothetical protein ACLKA6_006838 [Drosophila palustris]